MATIDANDSWLNLVESMRMEPRSHVRASRSPYDGSVQTVGMPGGYWQAVLTFRRLHADTVGVVRALVAQLQGGATRLRLYDLTRPVPRGTLRGEPRVNGANQIGQSLAIDGCEAGADLQAGDMIGVSGQLLMVTERCIANASGQMTVAVNFPLLTAPADNAIIEWDRVKALFVLDPDARPGWRSGEWWTEADALSLIQVRA